MRVVNKVSELISATGVWNDALIRRLFGREEAEIILTIPLSRRTMPDRLVWKLEKNGEFFVKTAYRFSFSHSSSRIPFTLSVNESFWKRVWKVLIPNAAKVFAWRVCHDILPSLERLAMRHVQVDSQGCVLCEGSSESTLHLCRDCPFTRQVLQGHVMLQRTCFAPQVEECDLLTWFNYCVKSLSLTDLGTLIFLLWSIWKERNSRVWEGKKALACDVMLRAAARLQ
ncbi:uncharacterized protein LOC133745065 [Rosa rugosa]|uniref:uncharacterized protein LOC133745065 n=1 Tax=Rosa rugosa TaxID=74645 RepID=UPI002B407D9F|nr:uncharacterized protein LOC133745065 [Rosa rugosa]